MLWEHAIEIYSHPVIYFVNMFELSDAKRQSQSLILGSLIKQEYTISWYLLLGLIDEISLKL